MNTKKTVKSLLVLLLFIFAVASAGLNIHQYRQIQEIVRATSAVTPPDSDLKLDFVPEGMTASLQTRHQDNVFSGGESQASASETDELLYQLDAAEEELDMIREQMAADEAKKAKQEELQKELSKMSRQIVPSKASIKASLEYQYADLYKKLNLTPEQLIEFKDLQAEQRLAQQELYSNYNFAVDMTEEEQKERSRQLREFHEGSESDIEAFLGDTEYAVYQLYSQTQSQRYQVKEFMAYLDSDEALSEPQRESLIEAMNEEQKNVVSENQRYSMEEFSNMSDEEKREMQLASYTRNNEAYLKAAKSVLSAAQVEKFEAYIEEETERQRLMIELSALQTDSF